MSITLVRKKKWLTWTIILIAAPCLYAGAFWYDLREIDFFCNSINTETKVSQLHQLAHENGVNLRGPFEYPESSGKIIAIAASTFTVGEYKCRVNADALHVTSKYLGYQ